MQQTILFNFNEKRMKEVFLALLFEDVWIQTFGLRYLLLYLIFFFFNSVPWKQIKFWEFSYTYLYESSVLQRKK